MPARTLSSARLFVFDTETTGLDLVDDRVVELGAVYFKSGQEVAAHRTLVNPGMPIPEEVSDLHGIRDADVATAPRFSEVAPRFVLHLDGRARDGVAPVLAGYNASAFDAPLLNAELARHGHAARIDPTRVVDPLVFVRWHHRDLRGRKLSQTCAHYGISIQRAHSASADARATGQLLYALVRAGRIPDDLDACLEEQARLDPIVASEFERFGPWIYRDRTSGDLRIGAGKHAGCAPDAVDRGYFGWVLENVEDLTFEARTVLERWANKGP